MFFQTYKSSNNMAIKTSKILLEKRNRYTAQDLSQK